MATFRCAVHQITWGREGLEQALDDIGGMGDCGTETFAYVMEDFARRVGLADTRVVRWLEDFRRWTSSDGRSRRRV